MRIFKKCKIPYFLSINLTDFEWLFLSCIYKLTMNTWRYNLGMIVACFFSGEVRSALYFFY